MPSKIVFLAHYSNLYGANISLLTFLKQTKLPKKKLVVIVPSLGSLTAELEKEGIAYIVQWFTYNTERSNAITLRRIIDITKKTRWLIKLFVIIKKISPKLIYSNSTVIYYGYFISKILSIPHIWHLREFGSLDYKAFPDFGPRFQKKIINNSSYVIAISKAIAKHFNIKPINSSIIYNGVCDDLSQFQYSSFATPLKFGIVGLITPYKNQLELIKIFHQFNKSQKIKAHLYIIGSVGNAEYAAKIENYLKLHHLNDDITMVGHIEDSVELYSFFDILLNGAVYEGFGRVTVEAMSYGKIPIGFNHSGTAEIIEDNITGILYNSMDELEEILTEINEDRGRLIKLQQSMNDNFNPAFKNSIYASAIDDIIMNRLSL